MQFTREDFVFFWRPEDENGYLGQWYPRCFEVKGVRYAHAEQYMTAMKALLFGDTECCRKIMNQSDPHECKKLGRTVKNFSQQIWNERKSEFVFAANYAKFSQNKELQALLLSTGDKILAEASPYDCIWGIGLRASDPDSTAPLKWRGENLLGKALMAVREKIRCEKSDGKQNP